MPELLPLVQRAVARDSTSDALRGLLVRTYVALDSLDSAGGGGGTLGADSSGDEAPYREWALALADNRADRGGSPVLLDRARGAEAAGGVRRVELAGLPSRPAIGRRSPEWVPPVTLAPTQAQTAVAQLAEAPTDQRERIVRAPHGAG